jgi:hypothetical protein
MLTFLNPITEDKQPAVAGEDLAQGLWCTEAGIDTTTGLPSMEKVDSDAIAKYDRHNLYVVAKYPIDVEYADTTYEDISDGDHLIRINRAGLVIEDNYLSTNSTTADWENASFGDALVLNTSGFLTISGAGDAGSGRTQVAKFVRYVNGIVWYEMV